jgi:hypothetical protein
MPFSAHSILAPEVMLGRAPRPWVEAAGTKKDQNLQEGNQLGVETLHVDSIDKKVAEGTTKKPTAQVEARL